MCSGVMVITPTITAWPVSMAITASRAAGTVAIRRPTTSGEAGRTVSAPMVPSTSSGSGRSQSWVAVRPMMKSTKPSR